MIGDRWTNQEIEMLHSTMTNQEIAKKINRSIEAVRCKRFHMTGHYVEKGNPQYRVNNSFEKADKEARLYMLAEKLGVKIGG